MVKRGAEAPLANSTLPQLRAQVNLVSQVGALPRLGARRLRSDAGSLLLGVGSTLSHEAPNRVERFHCSATAPVYRAKRQRTSVTASIPSLAASAGVRSSPRPGT